MQKIDKGMRALIASQDMWILRSKSGKGLGVSYSEEGLKLTANKGGKLLYYRDAYLRHKKDDSGQWIPYLDGDLTPSDKVYVEKFVPKDHKRKDFQIAEFRWVDKAHKMLYSNNLHKDFALGNGKKQLRTVYSSTEQKAAA